MERSVPTSRLKKYRLIVTFDVNAENEDQAIEFVHTLIGAGCEDLGRSQDDPDIANSAADLENYMIREIS